MNEWLERLEVVAQEIDGNSAPDPTAGVFHDIMSDAFIWTDERPGDCEHWIGVVRVLRPVWHHRTSLIVEAPDERTTAHWEAVCALCPNWIGLMPARRAPSKTLQRWYRLKKASMRRFLADDASPDDAHEG